MRARSLSRTAVWPVRNCTVEPTAPALPSMALSEVFSVSMLAREQRGFGLAGRERLALLVAAFAHDRAERCADHHADAARGRTANDRAAREAGAAALRAALARSASQMRVRREADCQQARDESGFTKFGSPGAHVPSPVVGNSRAVLLSRFITHRGSGNRKGARRRTSDGSWRIVALENGDIPDLLAKRDGPRMSASPFASKSGMSPLLRLAFFVQARQEQAHLRLRLPAPTSGAVPRAHAPCRASNARR